MAVLWRISLITALLLVHGYANAQSVSNILADPRLYTRLLETQKQYDEAIAGGDRETIAEASYLLGKRHIGLHNYYRARQLFLKSLDLRLPYGPSENIGKTYMRLLECEGYQGPAGSANTMMSLAQKALQQFQAVKSDFGLMNAYRGIAGSHQQALRHPVKEKLTFLPSIDSLFSYEYKALKLAFALKMPQDIGLTYECIASAWYDKGDFAKSIIYKKQSLRYYAEAKLDYNLYSAYLNIAKSYLENKQPSEARIWIDKASKQEASMKGLNYGQMYDKEGVLSDYYRATGNIEKALQHQDRYFEFKTASLNAYRDGALEGITMLYENEKKGIILKAKEKELAAKSYNMRLQIRVIALTSLLLVVAVLSGIFFYRLFKKYRALSIENEALVKEQNHRFKNNMQAIMDLLSLQLLRVSDPVAIRTLEESLLRVDAMTQVHRRLYRGDKLVDVELNKYIPDLVRSVLRSYHRDDVHVTFDLEDIWLHADKAVPLGLIINELTTNACKYAFDLEAQPTLLISCRVFGNEIRYAQHDNGPGFIPDENSSSFGLKLVDLMTQNIRGRAEFTHDEGSRFHLCFDVKRSADYLEQDIREKQPI